MTLTLDPTERSVVTRDAPSTSDVLSTKAHSSSSRSSVGASCRDYNSTREPGSVVRLAPDYATLGGASSSQTGSPHVTSKNSTARESAFPSKDGGLSTEAAPLVWASDAIADVTLQCDVSDDDDSVCVVEEVPRVKQEMHVYGRHFICFLVFACIRVLSYSFRKLGTRYIDPHLLAGCHDVISGNCDDKWYVDVVQQTQYACATLVIFSCYE